MGLSKRTYRIDENLVDDIKSVAAELRQSENQVVITALKLYRDYHHMQHKSTFINEQILHVVQGTLQMAENNINRKTNKLLSELAVQAAIQNMILANSLEVKQADLYRYRLQALDFLKQSQRIFRLDEANE
ncbi:hypothetical protein U6B65_14820 (plasmid) [Oscillospiraceae bacterium MB08-C2-2]|nr:hypothetical protein U6B65_14820 [Oscillospiraceae bacterium MB08-C2-2]